jgi:hypothetical protein
MAMAESNRVLVKENTAGDAAVEGVLAGLVAGLISALLLILIGLIAGDSPGTILGRFDPSLAGNPLIGGLLHLATSAVYGMIFAVFFRLIGRRWSSAHRFGWLLGLLYGLLLLFIAEVFILSGFETMLAEFSAGALVAFHIVYGLTLGFALERSNRQQK